MATRELSKQGERSAAAKYWPRKSIVKGARSECVAMAALICAQQLFRSVNNLIRQSRRRGRGSTSGAACAYDDAMSLS
ncbi:unnamed protein product, partial [Iphiclides podalirius]